MQSLTPPTARSRPPAPGGALFCRTLPANAARPTLRNSAVAAVAVPTADKGRKYAGGVSQPHAPMQRSAGRAPFFFSLPPPLHYAACLRPPPLCNFFLGSVAYARRPGLLGCTDASVHAKRASEWVSAGCKLQQPVAAACLAPMGACLTGKQGTASWLRTVDMIHAMAEIPALIAVHAYCALRARV